MRSTEYFETEVEARIGASDTTYVLRGELTKVLRACELLFSQFHPAGYGTHIARLDWERGAYVATLKRANSCE